MSDDVYTVISSDAHAGLPTPLYRDYLEQKYWPQFDDFLAFMAAAMPCSRTP